MQYADFSQEDRIHRTPLDQYFAEMLCFDGKRKAEVSGKLRRPECVTLSFEPALLPPRYRIPRIPHSPLYSSDYRNEIATVVPYTLESKRFTKLLDKFSDS